MLYEVITKAASVVKAGNKVYIKRGTYSNDVNVTTSGTAGNLITFDAYPGDELQVVLDGGVFRIKSIV